mmetsp:Transcript_46406/g.92072  ORF Transcript_46406/g.92072 Transcript_46406/m.92072 type:complete len:134 (+) Transcript_46406:77-478(+)
MVFYETFLMIHGRFPMSDTRLLFKEVSRCIVEREGAVFRIQDLGWRHTAYPVKKKNVGKFHYGRWFMLTWGGPPQTSRELREIAHHNTGVIRHLTQRVDRGKDLFSSTARISFYPILTPADRLTAPLSHHTPA